VEAMAVATIGGIRVSCKNGFAMDAFQVTVIRVADRAFLNNPGFVPFPWSHFVDVFMTVFTLNVIDKMSACIMFCPFLLMTAMAGNRLSMNLTSFCFPMGFHIRDIPVATIAGIGSVDRLGELPFVDLGMATEAFGIIDTLVAKFATLDGKLFPFR